MAVHFITLTTRAGKIKINPEHITSLTDLGDANAGEAKTNVLAGHPLFVMESMQEIMDACAHDGIKVVPAPEAMASEPAGVATDEKPRKRKQHTFTAVEKRNIKAAKRLEALSRSRSAEGSSAEGAGGEDSGSGSD